jgi:gluconolactonase
MRKLTLILLMAGGLLLLPAQTAKQGVGYVWRGDPVIDQIVPKEAVIEKVGGNFLFTEGPLWFQEGYLLFSDVPANVIRKWTPVGKVVDFKKPSGFDGSGAPAGALIGSNGLTRD